MYNGKSDYLFDCVEAGVVSDQPSFFPQQKCLNVNICTVNTFFFCSFSYFVIFCKQQGKQRKNAPHPKIFEPFFLLVKPILMPLFYILSFQQLIL